MLPIVAAPVHGLPLADSVIGFTSGAGFGVDAVGTTIQNEQIGAIYNTNVFDVHAQVGALVRVTRRGRRPGARSPVAWEVARSP